MSDESIKTLAASNNSLAPALSHINTKLRVKFHRSYLNQERVRFKHKKVVNIYIVYEISLWSYIKGAELVLQNTLFGADPDKYSYSGYGIGFEFLVIGW